MLYGVAQDVCDRYAVDGLRTRHPAIRLPVVRDAMRPIENAPRPETFARGVLQEVTSPASPAEPESSAPSTDTPAIDGGPGSVH